MKLPYLKDLGVDAIWMSPIFKSPMKDFGYDITDYRAIDEIFGTMQDFDELMSHAKRLGKGYISTHYEIIHYIHARYAS